MPKKFSLPSFLLVFGVPVLLVLVSLGFYYFKVLKPIKPPIEVSPEVAEKAKRGKEKYEEVKKEFGAMEEETKEKRPLLVEKCLYISTPDDPKIGIYRMDESPQGDLVDYYYEGRVVRVEEKDYQGCPYVYLTLKVRDEFTLTIPSNLLAKTDMGEVAPTLYKDHLGERVKIQIRYSKEDSKLKIVAWWPLVFVVE